MTKLTAADIAKKFSKEQDCQFWLTQKQTAWLFGVYQNETKDYSRFIGSSESGFRWEANKSKKSKTALFKFYTLKEESKEELPEETLNHPVYQYIIANGYTWKQYQTDVNFQIKILTKMKDNNVI